MDKFSGKKILILLPVLLCVSLVFSGDPNRDITTEHKQFYRYNGIVYLDRILELDRRDAGSVRSVTIRYNMIYSSLGAVWIYNGRKLYSQRLSRGMDQSVTFFYKREYPGEFTLKFTGNRGQIQVLSVSAVIGSQFKLKKKVETFKQMTFFRITYPSGGESWEVGETAAVHWDCSGIKGKLACELFRDRNKVRLFSRNIPAANGFFRFRLTGDDIVPGGNYQIRLTTLADRKSYVSNPFLITDKYQAVSLKKYELKLKTVEIGKKDTDPVVPIKLKVISPKYQEKWHLLQEYAIRWESEGLTPEDDIVIAMKQISRQGTKIITITKNTGEYRFKVPYPHIFMAFDVQVIITPMKDRSVVATSDPFVIMRPMVDLIPNTPAVSFRFPKKRKRKWWERLGDIFTGGVTWYVNEVVEITKMKAEGTTMHVDLNVFNKGLMTRKKVWVDCSVQTSWGNVLYSFEKQLIPVVYVDLAAPVSFSGRTKEMNLEKGRYTLEVFIDPDNKTAELEPFRKNNRLKIEFDVK